MQTDRAVSTAWTCALLSVPLPSPELLAIAVPRFAFKRTCNRTCSSKGVLRSLTVVTTLLVLKIHAPFTCCVLSSDHPDVKEFLKGPYYSIDEKDDDAKDETGSGEDEI
jgi:hypothetical protein